MDSFIRDIDGGRLFCFTQTKIISRKELIYSYFLGAYQKNSFYRVFLYNVLYNTQAIPIPTPANTPTIAKIMAMNCCAEI